MRLKLSKRTRRTEDLGWFVENVNESFASWLYAMNMNALTTIGRRCVVWRFLFLIGRKLKASPVGRLLRTLHLRWHREGQVLFCLFVRECMALMDKEQRKTLELLWPPYKTFHSLHRRRQDHIDRNNRTRNDVRGQHNDGYCNFWQVWREDGEEEEWQTETDSKGEERAECTSVVFCQVRGIDRVWLG